MRLLSFLKFINRNSLVDNTEALQNSRRRAFTIMDSLVSFLIISIIAAAFVPVVIKKVSHKSVAVNQSSPMSKSCPNSCKLCYNCTCYLCPITCEAPLVRDRASCSCVDCTENDPNCLKCKLDGGDLCTKGDRKTVCECCKSGYYLARVNGEKKCVKCKKGHYCDNCKIQPCPKNTYQDEEGQPECKPCPEGTYQDEEGQTVCKTPDDGQVIGNPEPIKEEDPEPTPPPNPPPSPENPDPCVINPNSCLPECCPAGQYASSDHTRCYYCPAGKYQDQSCKSACIECSEGSYSIVSGSTYCPKCTPGSYQNQKGQTICPSCEDGTCANKSGSTICKDCSYYTANCKMCSKTTCACGECVFPYCLVNGKCTNCVANYYKSGDKCVPCPSGTKTPQCNNLTSCIPIPDTCPEGCNCIEGQCPPGGCDCGYQYNSTTKKCDKCPSGKYSTKGGTCQSCPAGKYCPNAGTCAPLDCPEGTYSTGGQASCTPCPAGTYQNQKGQSSCPPCSAGTYQNKTGQTTCPKCDCGTSSKAGSASCSITCPAGQYSDAGGACKTCPAGHKCPTAGTCKPTICDCGYRSSAGATACTACAKGYYGEYKGAEHCKPCASTVFGYYCPSVGLCNRQICPAGQETRHAINGTFQSCSDCSANYYKRYKDATVCQNCPAGYYSHSGATGCTRCADTKCKVCTAASNGAECQVKF